MLQFQLFAPGGGDRTIVARFAVHDHAHNAAPRNLNAYADSVCPLFTPG